MALILKQAGLLTQTYGVQNAGTPGDLTAVGTGSFTRRPYGPSLSGWTHGWSADNLNTQNNFTWPIVASSGEDKKGMLCAWFYFGLRNANEIVGNATIEPLRMTNALAGNTEFEILLLNVSTMALQMASYNGRFTAVNCGTLPRHKWIWLAIAYEAIGTIWTLKTLYKTIGGTVSTLGTSATFDNFGNDMVAASAGTLWQNGDVIPCRIGLPRLYSMASMADAAYPTEVIDPETSRAWYVKTGAAGGGTGVSTAQAWTAAELLTETASTKFTVMSGEILDASGAVVDTTVLDANVVAGMYEMGTAKPNGDNVYFDDSSGPIRPATGINPLLSCGIRLLPSPSLNRQVEIRGTTRIAASDWSLDQGNIYKATLANTSGVLFEFDSTAEADSRNGRARWLTHGAFANVAAYRTGATAGSFWTDGTTVYVWPTGSGSPVTNGKVYECTTDGGNDIISLGGTHGLIKDLVIRYCAGVDNTNSASPTGRVSFCGDGMYVLDHCVVHAAGRHGPTVYQSDHSLHQRIIFLRNTLTDCRPAVYGDSSVIVMDNTTDGRDNQWFVANNYIPTNCGSVGSTLGIVDATQYSWLEHTTSGGAHPFSKGWAYNNRISGSTSTVGSTTTTFTFIGAPGRQHVLHVWDNEATRQRLTRVR